VSLAAQFNRAETDECAVKHVVPEYSPAEIDAAGDLVIDPPAIPDYRSLDWEKEDFENLQRVQEAYEIIYNFRSSHSFPLNTFQTTLRDKAHKVDADCIVAQRIKRLPTILAKLNRRKVKLSEIQDIGGCRAIVSSVARRAEARKNLRRQ
jgi:ppGpp synthetase/RelA/SpoT-type nucleotidyltranferase